jgi:hypothetical protein
MDVPCLDPLRRLRREGDPLFLRAMAQAQMALGTLAETKVPRPPGRDPANIYRRQATHRARTSGEPEKGGDPVNRRPGERVRHGRRTPGFRAKQGKRERRKSEERSESKYLAFGCENPIRITAG